MPIPIGPNECKWTCVRLISIVNSFVLDNVFCFYECNLKNDLNKARSNFSIRVHFTNERMNISVTFGKQYQNIETKQRTWIIFYRAFNMQDILYHFIGLNQRWCEVTTNLLIRMQKPKKNLLAADLISKNGIPRALRDRFFFIFLYCNDFLLFIIIITTFLFREAVWNYPNICIQLTFFAEIKNQLRRESEALNICFVPFCGLFGRFLDMGLWNPWQFVWSLILWVRLRVEFPDQYI